MEIISIQDKLPDIIWTRYFIEGQGYDIDEYMIFQDNMRKSVILETDKAYQGKKNLDQGLLQFWRDRSVLLPN